MTHPQSHPAWLGSEPRPKPLVILSKIEEAIGALLLLTIFVLLLIQVAQRYLPVATQPWIGEISRYSLMALTFIVVGSLIGQGRQVSIEAILNAGNTRFKRTVVVISSIITAMICAALARDSWALIISDTDQTLQITGIPVWWLYVIPFAGFVSATIQSLFNIVYAVHENEISLEDEAMQASADVKGQRYSENVVQGA